MNIKPKYKQQIYIQIKIEYKIGCAFSHIFGLCAFIWRFYMRCTSSINIKLYGKVTKQQ